MRGSRLDHLEELAEELIKENPEETDRSRSHEGRGPSLHRRYRSIALEL